MEIAVLISSHNRRDYTLDCLSRVEAQSLPDTGNITMYVVDAGSTDGTPEAIESKFPRTVLICADSSIFWNRGMHLAFEAAQKDVYDYYFWLNDDTMLMEDALSRFLATEEQLRVRGHSPGILVGSTVDPTSQALTYGGLRHSSRLNPLKLRHVNIGSSPEQVDTMNGNCVLITKDAAHDVGNLDWGFVHAMGDIDYGLRAKSRGIEVWTVPGAVGYCSQNEIRGSWMDTNLPIRQRWRKILGPKGLPPKSWYLLTRRHGGRLWPLVWVWPYVKLALNGVRRRSGS